MDRFFGASSDEKAMVRDALQSSLKKTEDCMICGEKLTYTSKAVGLHCIYCGRLIMCHINCPKGHYLCDDCHNSDAMQVIRDVTFTTDGKDPSEIAELLLNLDSLPMLGCQHSYVAAGAFMAAIRNEGSRNISKSDVLEVFQRTGKQAYGGYCGLTGICGITPAMGACFSVLTDSKCGKDREQRTVMEAVTRVASAITKLTGPSCCKAYVRTALEAGTHYLKESLDMELPFNGTLTCSLGYKHPHGCRKGACPFFAEA